jgi:hypothetical protein
MHDPLLISTAAVGLLVAVINAIVRKVRWNETPQLSSVIDILLSFLGITIAFKVAKIALGLPSNEVGDEEKLYFCLGSLAILWVSIESVVRRFAKPPKH